MPLPGEALENDGEGTVRMEAAVDEGEAVGGGPVVHGNEKTTGAAAETALEREGVEIEGNGETPADTLSDLSPPPKSGPRPSVVKSIDNLSTMSFVEEQKKREYEGNTPSGYCLDKREVKSTMCVPDLVTRPETFLFFDVVEHV